MDEKKAREEILKNDLLASRAEAVVSLRKFCESESQHEPCLNYRDCDECDVHRKIEELKEEVLFC